MAVLVAVDVVVGNGDDRYGGGGGNGATRFKNEIR